MDLSYLVRDVEAVLQMLRMPCVTKSLDIGLGLEDISMANPS